MFLFVFCFFFLGLKGCRKSSALCPSTSVWAFIVPPTFIVILLLHLQHSCRIFSLHAWSYNERRFCVTLQNTRFVLSASACFPFQLLEYFILDTDLTPVPIHEFIIRFGASQRELGAELVQDNVPIAFASKSFTETLSRL